MFCIKKKFCEIKYLSYEVTIYVQLITVTWANTCM